MSKFITSLPCYSESSSCGSWSWLNRTQEKVSKCPREKNFIEISRHFTWEDTKGSPWNLSMRKSTRLSTITVRPSLSWSRDGRRRMILKSLSIKISHFTENKIKSSSPKYSQTSSASSWRWPKETQERAPISKGMRTSSMSTTQRTKTQKRKWRQHPKLSTRKTLSSSTLANFQRMQPKKRWKRCLQSMGKWNRWIWKDIIALLVSPILMQRRKPWRTVQSWSEASTSSL